VNKFEHKEILFNLAKNLKNKTMTKSNYSKGQKISYTKEIMFKGTETISAKIVAIFFSIGSQILLLDNGDEIRILA